MIVRKQVRWASDLKRGDMIVSVEAHNAVTVEREEPAPAPEWKPGTVALATTPTGTDEQVMRTTAYGSLGPVWLDTHSNRLHESEVEDVRPLVVIDPATARGVEGMRVMRTDGVGGADYLWLSAAHVKGYRQHSGEMVTDFVPDDAEALRADAGSWEARYYETSRLIERQRAERPSTQDLAYAIALGTAHPSEGETWASGIRAVDPARAAERVQSLFEQDAAEVPK